MKTIPKKRKCKKAKFLSNEALQIAEERRDAKCKGERERYKKLNADFQRIARRDRAAFLNEQCKEIEENNRKGKTRDLLKKIGDIKGAFHAKMDMIKDNGRDLTEAEEIKKRWQEYTEELYQKDLGSLITADGDCSNEIKRCLLFGRKAMANLDSILKSRDITLPTKVRIVKAMVFPVFIYLFIFIFIYRAFFPGRELRAVNIND